jgi:hypothetical protein
MLSIDLRGIGFAEVRSRITGNRLEVYSRLLAHGPATCTELAAVMGWDKCSVRPRVSELCELAHAVATGNRRNSEHEFAALSAGDAEVLHEAATRRDPPRADQPDTRPAPGAMAQEIAQHAKEIQTGFFL